MYNNIPVRITNYILYKQQVNVVDKTIYKQY